MIYVALLRGINVGGNHKVEMIRLKRLFEGLGFENVITYINSGNVVFESSGENESEFSGKIEVAILGEFGFEVDVVVINSKKFMGTAHALPSSWQNDSDMKCDVMFLWKSIDSQKVLDELIIKPGIDEVKYVSGAILWRVDKENVTKSGIMKLVGTKLYKQMTVRNCNTVRKLASMIESNS
jgi:uncharacterized protein (DUF1697 family)